MAGDVRQLGLEPDPFAHHGLFARHFLLERLTEWPEFDPERFSGLRDQLRKLWRAEAAGLANANEAQTEERFIRPVLRALGFAFTVQAGLPFAGGCRQPDFALFLDDAARREADQLQGRARYERAIAVLDAKRFGRPLDGRGGAGERDDPVAQIINYVSITRRRWGVLTDGRRWRLFCADSDLVVGASYDVDLVELLEGDDLSRFRYFAGFFSTAAFSPDAAGRAFLDRVLEQSAAGAIAVGDELERQVFEAVPAIVGGLLGQAAPEDAALETALDHALVFLYRLLFCLFAEARALLPLDNPHYEQYSVRAQRVRLSEDVDAGRIFSAQSDDLWSDLRALVGIVSAGEPALGVNEYDGRLFAPGAYPWFAGRSVPDALLAPALDSLYRVGGQLVDYRDLSSRHLGSVYERLLDYRVEALEGAVILVAAPGRHESGSYYTPEFIVDRIVEATLEPILLRRSQELSEAGVTGDAALERFLELRVLDPAMGSGHFLVSAAAYVAVFITTDPAVGSDLALPDVQRLVAERCVYGVDRNPLAVELARLSLWLTTVRGDEPLTFLPNLRAGDALVGADVASLLGGEDGLFAERLARDARDLLAGLEAIGRHPSHSSEDVQEKERLAAAVDVLRAPLEALADDAVPATVIEDAGRLFHWELEFPEVFLGLDGRPLQQGGFDAIVGNPPWVQIQSIGRGMAGYLRDRYETATGGFDLFVPFVERSLALLRPKGRLGFIVPNRLLRIDYASRLRERLARDRLVEEIVDLGDAQLFRGATNYSCLLLLDRTGRDELSYARVRGDAMAVRDALLLRRGLGRGQLPDGTLRSGPLGPGHRRRGPALEAARSRDRAPRRCDGADLPGAHHQRRPGLRARRSRPGGRSPPGVLARGRPRAGARARPLRTLATGADVGRFAFEPLRTLLLFPYERHDAGMALVTRARLERLPLTLAYLEEHEERLRHRERGRMDHERWYAFGRQQNHGAHDSPKLGVAETVRRLEVAADPEGEIAFRNVRVNGILLRSGGPSLWYLLAVLNSRLLDFVFRRGSLPMAGGHFAANKQFIAPLPVAWPASTDAVASIAGLGRSLHDLTTADVQERRDYGDWLSLLLGRPLQELAGAGALAREGARVSLEEQLAVLRRNRARLAEDVDGRAFVERLRGEQAESACRLTELERQRREAGRRLDALIFELYEVGTDLRALVDSEYD